MGYSQIPHVTSITTPFTFWCADLFRSCRCRCPHFILLRRFSICTLTVGTTWTSQTPKLANLPLAKGLWFCYCPLFFFFLHHILGPFGVWRSASLWLSENSRFHIPLFFWDQSRLFWSIMLFLHLAEVDSAQTSSTIFGSLKGLSP